MEPQRTNAVDLSPEDATELKRIYGAGALGFQPSVEKINQAMKRAYATGGCGEDRPGLAHILYVRELTASEQELFGRRFVSPYLFEQTLYKVRGKLLPNKLNLAVRGMTKASEALRANYVTLGERNLCVVFDSRPDLPLPTYRNLEQVDEEDMDAVLRQAMAADMREPFDIVSGSLVRISVFHTGEGEYAVLVTAARLVAGGIDVAALLRSAMEGVPYKASADPQVPAARDQLKDSVKDYWRRVFTDFPPRMPLPYSQERKGEEYRQKSYRLAIPANLLSDLRREAKTNRLMLVALFLTAWGLALEQGEAETERALCILMPEETGELRIIPLRYVSDPEETCGQAVNRVFQKILVSRPYAKFGWQGLDEVAPEQGELFHHFLSFADFLGADTNYARTAGTPTGSMVMRNAYDALGMPLSVYFHDNEGNAAVSFRYDDGAFRPEGVPALASRYLLALSELLTDWNLPLSAFRQRLAERIAKHETATLEKAQESRAVLQHILSRLTLLQGLMKEGTLQDLMRVASMTQYFEGDRIYGRDMEENILFVAQGVLQRSMDAGDGWYNMLDLVGENEWINETAFLEKRTSHIAAEVISEEATIVRIPLGKMYDVFRDKPEIKDRMLQHILCEMEKYQKRWVQN
ncbi:MAG: hypothetical protein IJT01_10380 [Selenomonadaceae bacterium]|nr:hypothetical protein [Selenomonadaceae bacterium]